MGDGSADEHAAAPAAAGSAAARRDRRLERRPHADDARAHGDSPEESDVRFVPQVHGSDRARARQLRRHGSVARARERSAARHPRRFLRRHAGQHSCGPARGADEAADAARADVHGEPARVRTRSARRVLRHADGPRDREERRDQQPEDVVVHPGRDQERRVPDEAL